MCGQSLRSQSGRAIEEVGGSAGLARAGLERGLARNNEETRDGVRVNSSQITKRRLRFEYGAFPRARKLTRKRGSHLSQLSSVQQRSAGAHHVSKSVVWGIDPGGAGGDSRGGSCCGGRGTGDGLQPGAEREWGVGAPDLHRGGRGCWGCDTGRGDRGLVLLPSATETQKGRVAE